MTRFSAKDPNDTDDFTLNWATLTLGASETISAATATVVSGGVSVSGSVTISTTYTTVRLTGGTDGLTAEVLVRITTSAGRQIDETMQIPIAAQ